MYTCEVYMLVSTVYEVKKRHFTELAVGVGRFDLQQRGPLLL